MNLLYANLLLLCGTMLLLGCTNRAATSEADTPAAPTQPAPASPQAVAFVEAPPEAWLTAAQQRIDKHRKGDLTIQVIDAHGRPVPGAEVHVAMQRHAFGFGTAFDVPLWFKSAEDDPYLQWLPKLFNRVTFCNHMKWKWQANPEERAMADAAFQWLHERGIDVYGHTMIWGSLKWKAMPADVMEKLKSEDADRAEFLRRKSLEHIADVAAHYRGTLIGWDVVNEPVDQNQLQQAINPGAPAGREPIMVDWFKAARQADPDVPLYINDFHILVGDDTAHKDTYEAAIRHLLDNGAPLGGIGMQSHFYRANLRRTPEQMLETLDRFGRFGLPIHLSEFDTFGGGWGTGAPRQQAQADFLRQLYTVAFSHPSVEAITMWGFWDGRHWFNEAPLFNKDWTPKPALAVYQDLVFRQWWTDERLTADASGQTATRAFLGRYLVTVTAPGFTPASQHLELTRQGAALKLTLARP